MAGKRTPQTFQKRARELDKANKRQQKAAERIARKDAKKQARIDSPDSGTLVGADPNAPPPEAYFFAEPQLTKRPKPTTDE